MSYDLEATADAVRAGMEVLVWQVEEKHWHELGISNAVTENRKQHARAQGGLAAMATIIILPPIVFFAWPPDQAASLGFLLNVALLPVAGVSVYAFTLGAIRRTLGYDLPVVPMPPRVVFTSNGLIVGGHAWLWRAPHYRLVSAELHEKNPTQLRLKFRGTGWRRFFVRETIEIPFPSDLDHDLTELKELLDIKTRLAG